MRWVKVVTEMSSLVSMLFRTFLNPLKFLMEIFNILVYIYVCMYIYICQDGGAVGFVEFTKLLFALSSLAQPLKRVRSIP